ncbi:MAG: tetratricopeptide repeat protein [Bacteroidales bacterium]
MRRIIWIVFVGIMWMGGLHAQKPESMNPVQETYKTALELYERQHYGPAGKLFEDLSRRGSGEIQSMADFYAAVCAYKMSSEDAGEKLSAFVRAHPTSPKLNQARFYYGNFMFNNRSYKTAGQSYDLVDVYELPPDDLPEFYFKAGYCRYLSGDKEKARTYFHEIKDGKNPYATQASYYYGHILYTEGKYESALREFNKLTADPWYMSIVPYYIAQIYYRQEKYEELLKVAPPLLTNVSGKQKADIARMIGDAHLRLGNYTEAYDYLQIHRQFGKGTPDRPQAYALAYAAYKSGKTEEAIQYFQIAANGKDSLANNAWYHLGDCYLKTGNKPFAQNAFFKAYQLAYDQTTKEDALFNYAKLSYELASDPYSEAINALRKYTAEYPNSRRSDEAYQYLANLALITRNYEDALQALDNIKNKDIRLKTAQQRIQFFRGIELFNDNQYSKAISMLEKAAEVDYDKSIRPRAYYWSAEALYRLGNYNQALAGYNKFLLARGASSTDEFATVHYQIGYCYFKMNDYDQASVAFRKFTSQYKGSDKALINDAWLRTGDCFFAGRNYAEAINAYQRVISNKGTDADYAWYQIGLAYGVQRNFQEKIQAMNNLAKQYPNSPHAPAALYETALTCLVLNKEEEALGALNQLIARYPRSIYVSKAMLRKGLIYYNQSNYDQSLAELKAVVSKFPGTPEAREAMVTISNIYVDLNRVPEYLAYVKTVPFTEVSMSTGDSLLYVAAENQYQKGDCRSSSESFYEYLSKNPQGKFSTQAWYYVAECARKNNNPEEALRAYENVIARPGNSFMDLALRNAARISQQQNNCQKALRYFNRLEGLTTDKSAIAEAQTGQMKCYYTMGRYDSTLYFAQRLLTSEKISQEQSVEAHLYMARSAHLMQNYTLAEKEFQILSRLAQGLPAAEAWYHLAQMAFNRNDLKKAEKDAFTLINNYPSADYWRVKGFLLLADIYSANGNIFQARQTLQSIIDNYEGEDLKAEARTRLDKLPQNP